MKRATQADIEKIVHLYQTTNMTMKEIGVECGGFSDATVLFHVKHHTTPEYRKERAKRMASITRLAVVQQQRAERPQREPAHRGTYAGHAKRVEWTPEMDAKLLDLFRNTTTMIDDMGKALGTSKDQARARLAQLTTLDERNARKERTRRERAKAAGKIPYRENTRKAPPKRPKNRPDIRNQFTRRAATPEELAEPNLTASGQHILKAPLPGQPLTLYVDKPDDPWGRMVARRREMDKAAGAL